MIDDRHSHIEVRDGETSTHTATAATAALIPTIGYMGCLYSRTTSWVPENAVDQFLQMRPLLKPGNLLQVLCVFLVFWGPTMAITLLWRKVAHSSVGVRASGPSDSLTEATVISTSIQTLCATLELLILLWLAPDIRGMIGDYPPSEWILDMSSTARSFMLPILGGTSAVLALYVMVFRALYRKAGRSVAWAMFALLSLAHGCTIACWIEGLMLYFYVPVCRMNGA